MELRIHTALVLCVHETRISPKQVSSFRTHRQSFARMTINVLCEVAEGDTPKAFFIYLWKEPVSLKLESIGKSEIKSNRERRAW